MKLQMKN